MVTEDFPPSARRGRPTNVVRTPVDNPLTQWLQSLVGPGKTFPSYHAISKAADLAPATVRSLLYQGSCTAPVLIAIAKATNTPVKRVFYYAGWLAEWDLEYHGVDDIEEEILNGVRAMTPQHQQLVVAMIRPLLQSAAE